MTRGLRLPTFVASRCSSPMKIAPTTFSGAFIHTRCVTIGLEQPAQHTQSDRGIQFGSSKQERGGSGAGDQQEDHHVVQALQPANPNCRGDTER